MTTPALLVLSLALVCSISVTALETADHDSRQQNMKNRNFNVPVNRWINHNHKSIAETKMSPNGMKMRTFNEILEKHNKYDQLYYNRTNNKDKTIIDNNNITITNAEKISFIKMKDNFDEIYSEQENILETNLRLHKINVEQRNGLNRDTSHEIKKRVKRDDEDPRCESFKYNTGNAFITHPHASNMSTYYNNSNCVTVINATSDDMVIELTFVDIFRIEYHSECAYDYLEIHDGIYGYANLLAKVCGQAFPRQITTTGPHAWLKFYSDDTIEYEGFKINVAFKTGNSHRIPNACYITKDGPNEDKYGVIDSKKISDDCLSGSLNQPLDVLWKIETAPDTKIYLNFTKYHLQKPNECDQNVIQVFGSVLELNQMLSHYCGSVANSVMTSDGKDGKDEKGNIMYIRFHVAKAAKENTFFNATYNAFRTLDPSKESEACLPEEFSCEDNTCISADLVCDNDAHCRLKADEEKSRCDNKTESTISQPHIMVILIIFSLILSGMCFVFLFKCMRKLYQDHKLITEHFKQSCEDRLDRLGSVDGSRLTLDPKTLQRDSEPRASLERENHTNEMYKKQRSFSKHEPSCRESDFIEETHLDLEDDPWRREAESIPIEDQDIRIERNGRTRRSDLSRKEESMRSRTKESESKSRLKKEIRDVSVGAPDTKESGCQTRESLFQTDPPPSSDGSGTQSRGFSTFGYSGATIVRPSPPDQTKTSEITIELMKQPPPQESKPQKKPDRRPISTETTRSAPDVIIVSKPIR